MKNSAACVSLAAAIGLAAAAERAQEGPTGELDEAARSRFARRFEREVWPLMTGPADARKACVGCHHDDGSNTSDFVLPDDPLDAFGLLLDEGFFDEGNPNAVLSRVARQISREADAPRARAVVVGGGGREAPEVHRGLATARKVAADPAP